MRYPLPITAPFSRGPDPPAAPAMTLLASIDAIGPAFADEIFRVFALRQPDLELVVIDTDADVERVIARESGHAQLDG